jgi:hypothetical protein
MCNLSTLTRIRGPINDGIEIGACAAAAQLLRSSRAQRCRRLSVREPKHLVLARPRDRRVEEAGDADPAWQSTFDGSRDEARCEEGQRDRHVDVALAAGLLPESVTQIDGAQRAGGGH